jgi:integrase
MENVADGLSIVEPLRFRILETIFESGERMPMLVDAIGAPIPLPNRYVLSMLRPSSQRATIEDHLRAIASQYEWASRRGINVEERILSGNALSSEELSFLVDNLRFTNATARAVAGVVFFDAKDVVLVAGPTHKKRFLSVRSYLLWLSDRCLHSIDVRDPTYPFIRERLDRMKRALSSYSFAKSSRPELYGLSETLIIRLFKIVNPSSADNPFNAAVRVRNYVVILLLFTDGFRRAEILKFKLADLNIRGTNEPTLKLFRRPDDPDETRLAPPSVKTNGREVPIERSCAKLLNDFILYHRGGSVLLDTGAANLSG